LHPWKEQRIDDYRRTVVCKAILEIYEIP